MPLLLSKELEKECHGDDENIKGFLKSFYIYLYLRRKECVDYQETHPAMT